MLLLTYAQWRGFVRDIKDAAADPARGRDAG